MCSIFFWPCLSSATTNSNYSSNCLSDSSTALSSTPTTPALSTARPTRQSKCCGHDSPLRSTSGTVEETEIRLNMSVGSVLKKGLIEIVGSLVGEGVRGMCDAGFPDAFFKIISNINHRAIVGISLNLSPSGTL